MVIVRQLSNLYIIADGSKATPEGRGSIIIDAFYHGSYIIWLIYSAYSEIGNLISL